MFPRPRGAGASRASMVFESRWGRHLSFKGEHPHRPRDLDRGDLAGAGSVAGVRRPRRPRAGLAARACSPPALCWRAMGRPRASASIAGVLPAAALIGPGRDSISFFDWADLEVARQWSHPGLVPLQPMVRGGSASGLEPSAITQESCARPRRAWFFLERPRDSSNPAGVARSGDREAINVQRDIDKTTRNRAPPLIMRS